MHNCLTTHMLKLRQIYKQYSELYLDSKEENPERFQSLSMSKISLWQLMRDCDIHTKGIGLAELERRLGLCDSFLYLVTLYVVNISVQL